MKKKSNRVFYDAQKHRTNSTALAVIKKLESYTEEDILNTVFMTSNVPFIKSLINKIEYILMDAKINPERFSEQLHDNLHKIAESVVAQNKMREYYEYVHLMYEHLHLKGTESLEISDAYFDLAIQAATYFVPHTHVTVGIDSEGQLLTIPELYPDIDKVLYECTLKAQYKGWDFAQVEKLAVAEVNKLGHSVKDFDQINLLLMQERIICNMQFVMTPFVTDLDSEFLKKPYPAVKIADVDFGYRYHSTRVLEENLQERKRLLPSKGITLVDDTCSISEVYLKEKFIADRLYLLYRANIYGCNFCGYYNTSSQFFSSIFIDAAGSNLKIYNKKLKNYILERYAILSTNMESDLELFEKEEENKGSSGTTRKKYAIDRTKLVKTKTEVEAYVRRLPSGSAASDDAIALARRYGITLAPDETFVKPFVKQVGIKKIDT